VYSSWQATQDCVLRPLHTRKERGQERDNMSLCPGCGISYCLDCDKSVDPDVFRCEDCQKEHLANDPFVLTAQETSRLEREFRESTKKKAQFIHDVLVKLQSVVHGSADESVRDEAYHAVIELRNFVKSEML
jgi:hypothetical protein